MMMLFIKYHPSAYSVPGALPACHLSLTTTHTYCPFDRRGVFGFEHLSPIQGQNSNISPLTLCPLRQARAITATPAQKPRASRDFTCLTCQRNDRQEVIFQNQLNTSQQ